LENGLEKTPGQYNGHFPVQKDNAPMMPVRNIIQSVKITEQIIKHFMVAGGLAGTRQN